jgi:hypothetical protein
VASLPRCTATIVRLCVCLLAKSCKMFGLSQFQSLDV